MSEDTGVAAAAPEDVAANATSATETATEVATETATETATESASSVGGVSMLSGNADNARESWCDELPDDLKDNRLLRSFKEPEDALKSLISAQKMLGRKGLQVPPEGSPKEDWDAYFTARRGGLAAADDYRFKYDEGRMVGMNPQHYKELSQFLYDNGFGDREHSAVMYALGTLRKVEADEWEDENDAHCKACRIELMEKLGERYETEMSLVRNFMDTRFPGVKEKLQRYGLENDTAMMEFLMYAAHAGQEGRAPAGAAVTAKSAATLDKRVADLWATPALRDRTNPGHAEAQRQFRELMSEKAAMRERGSGK